MRPPIAVSIGDINGIGPRIALAAHAEISRFCRPFYTVHESLMADIAARLSLPLPDVFTTVSPDAPIPSLHPGQVGADSGRYSYASFTQAVELARKGEARALVTLPIHKKAWQEAGLPYKGHTDALRDIFQSDAIMMLGCRELWVALYTDHIPLKQVPDTIEHGRLARFLVDFQRATGARKIGVLGLNPHAGDDGVLGHEESIITQAIQTANQTIQSQTFDSRSPIFEGPLVPDVAFIPDMRRRHTHYVAMYHDQGLTPLKTLYFDRSINVSLGLPVVRTSVDHGTAFDIAYRTDKDVSLESYIEAVEAAVRFSEK